MSKLIWTEKDGTFTASASGFEYEIDSRQQMDGEIGLYALVRASRGIEFSAACSRVDFGKKFCEFFANAIQSAIDEAVAKACTPQWVSVEERLPEKDDYYWTCSKEGSQGALYFYTSSKSFSRNKEVNGFITHWVSLPEPPIK